MPSVISVLVRSLAGDDASAALVRSAAAEWNVLRLKQELSILTGCPVRQQVLLSEASATPLANWSRLEEVLKCTAPTEEAKESEKTRLLELTLVRLEKSQSWSDSLDALIARELPFNDLPPQLQSDRNFLLGALEADGLLLEPWPGEVVDPRGPQPKPQGEMLPEHRADADLVALAVAQNPAALRFATCSRPMLLSVLPANGTALQFASKGYRNDPQVVLAAVTSEGDALQHASAQRRQDRAIVLAAVRRQGRALQAAAPQLRDDKEVVMAAVRNEPMSLQHASVGMQDDEELVLAASSKDPQALRFASPRLRSDEAFVRSIGKAKALRYALAPKRAAQGRLRRENG
eukprot:s297_g4.t1